MSEEQFQKVGRGGAGNFQPKKDVEVELREWDPEAQKPLGSSSVPERSVKSSNYVRSGRGGAGNFNDEPMIVSSGTKPVPRTTPIDTPGPGRDKVKTAYRGHSGRGGAGNWRQAEDEAEKRRVEAEERNARVKLAEQVRIDVDMGLTAPPKVHATPGSSRRESE